MKPLHIYPKTTLRLFRKTLYSTFLFLALIQLNAQDPHFSQFYANPLYLGPSFAGATEGGRVAAQHRIQWFGLGRFVTYSASYDYYFSSFNSGVGVNFLQTAAGSSKLGILGAGLHYSYNLKVFNVWHIRPGLSFSYLQNGIFGDIKYIDEILSPIGSSAASTAALEKTGAIDAGSSLLIYTHNFWIGATFDHLLTPNTSLYGDQIQLPIKTSVYGGIDLRRRGKLLKPSEDVMTFAFLYKQQDNIPQLDLGVYWTSEPFVLGVWYRGIPYLNSKFGDAVIFLAGIKTRNVNVGYSYDLPVSSLLPHAYGTHEISASVKFHLPKRRRKGAVPCPEF